MANTFLSVSSLRQDTYYQNQKNKLTYVKDTNNRLPSYESELTVKKKDDVANPTISEEVL